VEFDPVKLLRCVAIVALTGLAVGLARSPAAPAYTVHNPGTVHPHAPLLHSAESLGYQIPAFKFQGASSCSASGCHNGGIKQAERSEFSTWAGYDPHKQKAYQVLFNEQSKRIVRNLNKIPNNPDVLVLAHRETLCLKCHSTCVPGAFQSPVPLQVEISDAVACEACHGAAEKYKTVHYLDEWKSLDRKQKAEQYGLFPTKDLAFRVRMCGSCHIGQEGSDVNHTLIAAGHPALRFEYTSHHFHPEMTRHWTEKNYGPDFDARAWEIGQLSSARTALELMLTRMKSPEWPELAEFNCFSCHHDLQPGGWKNALPAQQAGSFRWGTWYDPLVDVAGGVKFTALEPLTEQMKKPLAKDKILVLARELLKQLDTRLIQLQCEADRDSRTTPYTEDQLIAKVKTLLQMSAPETWDGATQRYLAASSIYHSVTEINPARKDADLQKRFTDMADVLRFPIGYNSPSRDRFTPDEFQKTFSLLRQRLIP